MTQETTATNSLCSENARDSLRTKLVPAETDLGKRVVFYTTLDKERFGTLR